MKLVPAITETGDARSVEIEAKVVDPEFTTADAKKLKIKERVSSFSTFFPYAEYRNINQGRAAELIDGTILEPGETFSMNDTVGERTNANGFTPAPSSTAGCSARSSAAVSRRSPRRRTTRRSSPGWTTSSTTRTRSTSTGTRWAARPPSTTAISTCGSATPPSTACSSAPTSGRSTPGRQGEMHVEMWSTKVWSTSRRACRASATSASRASSTTTPTAACRKARSRASTSTSTRTFLRDGKVVKRENDTAVYQAADHVICGKKP